MYAGPSAAAPSTPPSTSKVLFHESSVLDTDPQQQGTMDEASASLLHSPHHADQPYSAVLAAHALGSPQNRFERGGNSNSNHNQQPSPDRAAGAPSASALQRGGPHSHHSHHRKRKWRLPQSGLTLCGRRWLLGAEDMCLPACSAMSFDAALLILAVVSWRYVYITDFPPDDQCSAADRRQLENWCILHAFGYFGLLCADIATMFSSLRSNMFKRNKQIVWIIYLRLLGTLAVVLITLIANIEYFSHLHAACVPSWEHAGTITLNRLLSVLFITSLCSFLVFGGYFLCAYGFGPLCGKGTTRSWGKHIRRWLLCYTPTPNEDGRNVLESISEIFTSFFAADRAWALKEGLATPEDGVHIVPSDILVGLALVEASQQRRQALGYEFLKAAPRNRWEPDAFRPTQLVRGSTAQQEWQVSYGATSTATAATAVKGNSAATRQGDANNLPAGGDPLAPPSLAHSSSSSSSSSSSDLGSPDLVVGAAERSLREAARTKALAEQVLEHERPESGLAQAARLGVQPSLDYRDWQKIADARHFSKFSEASYGWPLYTFNNLGCLFTCAACRCCTRAKWRAEEMVGSGFGCACVDRRCCHWSLSSFLLTTGVADEDVLYAHLSSSPIYYLTVDHHQKTLVVCCRGTLSVADAVIDLDAALAPLDSYGYPGGYTHLGILENARRLRDDIEERGIVDRFLRDKPHYNITVVGHSLGAATASLLTLLLREKYDTGPPAETTTGRLTSTTRNRLICIAYGGPLLVSLNVAHSEFALRCMTSVVYNADIITRLSLANCALLKDQMISCFSVSSSSKFKILSNSLRKKYAYSFEPGVDVSQLNRPEILHARGRLAMGTGTGGEDDRDELAEGPEEDLEAGLDPAAVAAGAHVPSTPTSDLHAPADGSARGGDITSQLLLGSVSKALRSMDALPEPEREGEEHKQDDDADERAHRLHQLQQQQRQTHQLSPPLKTALQASSSSSSEAAGSSAPLVPAAILTPVGPAGSSSSSASASPASSSSSSQRGNSNGNGNGNGALPPSSSFTLHLRKCYLPGRIYHVLPGVRPPAAKGCAGLLSKRPPRPMVVYPSSQDTFQEIVVSSSMFLDHMPRLYALDRLQVPQEYHEARDNAEGTSPASPSPEPPRRGEAMHREASSSTPTAQSQV